MQSPARSTSTQNSTTWQSPLSTPPQLAPQSPQSTSQCQPHLGAGPSRDEEITSERARWPVSAAEIIRQMRRAQQRDGFSFDISLLSKVASAPLDSAIRRLNRQTPLETLLSSDCFVEHVEFRGLLLQGSWLRELTLADREWAQFCETLEENSRPLTALQFSERTRFLATAAQEGVRLLQNCCRVTLQNCPPNLELQALIARCRGPLKGFAIFLEDRVAELRQSTVHQEGRTLSARRQTGPRATFDPFAKWGGEAEFIFEKLLLSFVRSSLVSPPGELKEKVRTAKSIVALKTLVEIARKSASDDKKPSASGGKKPSSSGGKSPTTSDC